MQMNLDDENDEDFNFTMNVNTNTSGMNTTVKGNKNKKKDKKERYLEKKLLQSKRKREKNEEKRENRQGNAAENQQGTQQNTENENLNENVNETVSENVDIEKDPLRNKISEKMKIKQPTESENVYDELNEFYSKQEMKNRGLTTNPLTSKEKGKKRRELENQINVEFKEIGEEKEKVINETKVRNADTSKSVFSIKNFEDLELNQYLKRSLAKNNFTQMTKVQKKSIPILLKHKNVVVKSETGSGKTLAYVIPLYEHLIKINEGRKIERRDGVYAVIFAPTHELCLQIEETFNKLKSSCINVVYGSLMGGQKIEREKQKLRKGFNVIISTPGRLLYHLKNTQNLKFDRLKFLIFDEGDILLAMGFEKDIKECLSIITQKGGNIPNNSDNAIADGTENSGDNVVDSMNIHKLHSDHFKKYKIFLISATIDNKIRSLVEFLMKGFKTVGFDLKTADDEEIKAPNGLNQYYSVVYDEFRLIHLIAFLRINLNKKIIIFVSTCDSANLLVEMFKNLEIDRKSHSENSNNISKRNHERNNNERNNNENSHGNSYGNRSSNNGNNGNNNSNNENNDFSNTPKEDLIPFLPGNIYRLHGKMDHAQRKEIFREFNKDQPGLLISTDVAARGLDFPMVDWIIHYDVNPDPKEYLNRMGRTARLDQTGNSLIFLMKHEEAILQTCLKPFVKNMTDYKCGKLLLEFVNCVNQELVNKIKFEPEPYKDEVDENEKFRKKYFFAICPLQRCIKSYLFKSRDNLILARKAFKSSVRSYVTFMRHAKDVFNVKTLNLTRFARSFGLYKESTKVKVGDQEMLVDYQIEKNKTKGEKRFNNKKIQRRIMISEFDN